MPSRVSPWMRGLVVFLLVLAVPRVASADSTLALPRAAETEAPFAGEGLPRPPIEWSTWLRASLGGAVERTGVLARSAVSPPRYAGSGTWELGAGIEASLALSPRGNLRLGAWFEQRGLSTDQTFGGGELVVTRVPRRLDMFLYEGHGIVMLRAGASPAASTVSLSYGYVAPFWLEGPCRERFFGIQTGVCHPRPERTTRMMAGVRAVATVTRDRDDARVWSATLGLEFEPDGALRMLLAARSWYAN